MPRPALPPGPRLPMAAQTLLMWRWRKPFLDACRRRYGRVFTVRDAILGPIVYVADREVIREVFAGDPAVFHAGEANAPVLGPIFGPRSISVVDDDDHMLRRKLMLPAVHGDAVGRYADAVTEVAEDELDRWPVGRPFALHPRMHAIALELILRVAFGDEDPARLDELRAALGPLDAIDDVQGLTWLWPGLDRVGPWRRRRRLVERADGVVFAEIRRRRAAGVPGDGADVLSLLLAARDARGAPLDDADVRDQLVSVVVSSQVTVPTALAWMFEQLLREPAALARARSSAREGDDAYLDAVVQESLRLRPVFFDFLRRLARPARVAGRDLPSGTRVAAAVGLVHRSPDLYPSPDAFVPERFLHDDAPPYAWIPFGCGIHRCLGAPLVRVEMKGILATVLRRAQLRPASPRRAGIRQRHITYQPTGGPRVVLDGRSPRERELTAPEASGSRVAPVAAA